METILDSTLKHIFKGPFKNSQINTIFNSSVIPTLTRGSQIWVMNKKEINTIRITQNSIEHQQDRIKH